MANNYKIENVYQGGVSSFSPNYGGQLTEARVPVGNLSITNDSRTANILSDISSKLGMGIKNIEVQGTDAATFESMPVQHLKEANRLAKLTGVELTFHGPIIEPSGVSKDGFSDFSREAAERQMFLAVQRAHDLNPKGNIPVTFHSSAQLPGEIIPKGKERPDEFLAINIERGSFHRIPITEKKFPGEEKATIKQEIEKINEQSWKSNLTQLAHSVERASEYIGSSEYIGNLAREEEKAGKSLEPEEKRAKTMLNVGEAFLQDSYREFKDLYETAYKRGGNDERKVLDNLSKEIEIKVGEINKSKQNSENLDLKKEIVEIGLEALNKIKPPKLFDSLSDFSKEKTVETFANLAFDSYKSFKDTAPIITIENPPAGGAFSTGDELKDVIEKSRKKFIEIAKEKGGLSEKEATKQAEKLLGVTWDVGHINMLKKYGYEDKDILAQTDQIAPLTKHVHLSDNFGFEHTELPMGMGNVPTKEILDRLNKEGFKGKQVIEAFSWWQHFKSSPLPETIEAMGSPIYSMQMAPSWNQSIGFQQGYFSGYGQMLPAGNYETFGAGFSTLPAELGGQRSGAGGSRMSGRGME
jgi:sugar phosphate isomerase/epimerase